MNDCSRPVRGGHRLGGPAEVAGGPVPVPVAVSSSQVASAGATEPGGSVRGSSRCESLAGAHSYVTAEGHASPVTGHTSGLCLHCTCSRPAGATPSPRSGWEVAGRGEVRGDVLILRVTGEPPPSCTRLPSHTGLQFVSCFSHGLPCPPPPSPPALTSPI